MTNREYHGKQKFSIGECIIYAAWAALSVWLFWLALQTLALYRVAP